MKQRFFEAIATNSICFLSSKGVKSTKGVVFSNVSRETSYQIALASAIVPPIISVKASVVFFVRQRIVSRETIRF